MNKHLDIKKASTALSIFGLVLLLLLSPCKVRNFIQAEFGFTQTEVSNKSLTTISQHDCQYSEFFSAGKSVSELSIDQANFVLPAVYNFGYIAIPFKKQTFTQKTSLRQNALDVPLYILYQNLKVYS